MITVTITRNSDNVIQAFTVNGHANYAEYGKDIVCAGVSAVTIGVCNALILMGLINKPDIRQDEGYLSASFDATAQHDDKAQLILETMIHMLNSIIEAYPDYVQLKEVNQCSQV